VSQKPGADDRSTTRFETWGAADQPAPLTRRQLIVGGSVLLGGLALAPRALAAEKPYQLSEPVMRALGSSPLVYVAPLRKDGSEGRCHGEVWYFVDQGSVIIITGTDGWKVKSIVNGRAQARLWVGDFGPAKKAGDQYRGAPTFLADAQVVSDRKVFDRLLVAFAERYPKEWAKWKPRFEKGFVDGSRTVIRYRPLAD